MKSTITGMFLSILLAPSLVAAPILKDLVVKEETEGYYVAVGDEISFRNMQPNKVYAFYKSEDAEIEYAMALPVEAELPGMDQIHDRYESDEHPVYSGRYAILPVVRLAVNAVLPGKFFNTEGIDADITWTSFRLIRGSDFEWVSTPTEERPFFRSKVKGSTISWSMEQNSWRLNKAETYTQFDLYISTYTHLFMGRTMRIVNAPREQIIINIYQNIHHWRM